jgi:hypothetical protein
MFEDHKEFCEDQHTIEGHEPTECFLDWVREKIGT